MLRSSSWAASQGGLYLDLVQQKTQKEITEGIIHPYVVDLLQNHFPYPIPHARFNRYMKAVLKAAGIHQKIYAARYEGKSKRKIYGIYPKYQVMSSHDQRSSFATNFFGKIPTPILMQMTGHTKESTFLQYIGHDPNRDSFADAFIKKLWVYRLKNFPFCTFRLKLHHLCISVKPKKLLPWLPVA